MTNFLLLKLHKVEYSLCKKCEERDFVISTKITQEFEFYFKFCVFKRTFLLS